MAEVGLLIHDFNVLRGAQRIGFQQRRLSRSRYVSLRRTEGAPPKEAAAVAVKMAEEIRHEDAEKKKEDETEATEVPITGGYSSDGHAGDGR